MFKMTIPHTGEQLAILKFAWIELFDDLIRERRLKDFKQDFTQGVMFNLNAKYTILKASYTKEEKERFKHFEKKVKNAVSFNLFIEEKDILDSLFIKL